MALIKLNTLGLPDNVTVAGNIDVSDGTVKLDGNYPVGTNNVAFGDTALDSISTGGYNTAIGHGALTDNVSADSNTAVGSAALTNTTGANNTGVGNSVMFNNSSGANNTAVGTNSLFSNTTASNNTAVGFYALNAATTGGNNTAVGHTALENNTTGQRNTAVGLQALELNTSGTDNVAVGLDALEDNTTGLYNTAVGNYALTDNTTGGTNTAVGYQAGHSGTTIAGNTLIGKQAGYALTTANGNTFIGSDSGDTVTTGQNNTIIGRYNGNQGGLDIRTSNNNIVLSDGDGNPRQIISSNGSVGLNGRIPSGSGTTLGGVGAEFNNGDKVFYIGRDSGSAVFINRITNDGGLVEFMQDNSTEGNISVSGTTVSYNGGHLSRWSQLADNTRDESIVKGTVMSNLDQMAEWTHEGVTEDNEQLNCMKVSDTEGDADVAGVFVNWDNDDDIYTNDMNVAMTGDMVIRIAQSTTVARGDLLMSAGDGTAKPQGDDIVRSKTIAKVTSTHVSHTYDDGSYLVPCVLMAC